MTMIKSCAMYDKQQNVINFHAKKEGCVVQNNNNHQSWQKIQTVVFWFLSALKDDHNVWKITKFWFWDKENGLKFQSNMSQSQEI